MNRLTVKKDRIYYPANESVIFPDDGSNACRLLQIIGKYEDLEEELGIDLITLFKAFKEGIWYKTIKHNIYHISKNSLVLVFNDEWELWVEECTILNGLLIHLKDYKKTWALNRSDLEDD